MVLAQAVEEFLCSANMAFGMYPGLTAGRDRGASRSRHRTEQKALYLPKLIAGAWTGTMCLTEPQCGTDLGLIRTKAVPQADGSYQITGTKIFISAGEHDLTENIIHLVLARIDGRAGRHARHLPVHRAEVPAVDADGALGARNGVSCGSIEHKMGIHGNATCVMNFDGATGWLVGEPNRGMPAMFTMMNEARLGVGMQGLALAEVAYQNAAAYAKDRCRAARLSGAESPRQARRSDHRPSRRAPHADDHARLQRGGARARAVGRAAGRRRAPLPTTRRAAGGRRSRRA